MSGSPLLIGIDAGTTQVRAIVFNPRGEIIASGYAPTPLVSPAPGTADFDPESLWSVAVTAIRAAVSQVDEPARIAALACISMGESGIPLDSKGQPLARGLAWFDNRPLAEVELIAQRFGEKALQLQSGMRLDPVAGLCKMLWFKHTNPDAFAKSAHWLHVADFIAYRLCGEIATDLSLAGRTLALDFRKGRWADESLADLGIGPGWLPPIVPNGTPLGSVKPEVASMTGLPRDCVVAVGGLDHIIGALGMGIYTQHGTLLDSIGTNEALLLALEHPLDDPAFVERGFEQGLIDTGEPHYFILGGIITASASVEWLRNDVLGGLSHETLIHAAEDVPAGSLGALFVPHLRMGSPPDVNPQARGAFLGLSPDTGWAVLYRAVLEGLAFDARNIVENITTLAGAPPVRRILVTGGGSRNTLLARIKASVYGRDLEIADIPEAGSLGAAILAGLSTDLFEDIDEALASVKTNANTVRAEAEWAGYYDQRFSKNYRPALKALATYRNDSVSTSFE